MASPPKARARAPEARRPDFSLEREARTARDSEQLIIGVDEVGRGPFAGPVVAGAAWLSDDAASELEALGLDDSKRLSPKRKGDLSERIAEMCRSHAALVALGAASVREIDRLNIGQATALAMRRAVGRLARDAGLGADRIFALVDGKHAPALPCALRMVIGGDGKSLSIAAGALMAKMARDRLMRRLAERYPAYGWETNVGYGGARRHREAILALGLTPHHRMAFCRNLLAAGVPK